jgi:acetyltransferase-like isoleucine patch superfamily enzyme
MAVEIVDRGARNRVAIAPDVLANGVAEVIVTGDDNEIVIGPGVLLAGAKFELGSRCRVTVGPNCNLAAIHVFAKTEARVSIGGSTGLSSTCRLQLHEPGSIAIGERCLIGRDIVVTVSDVHAIFDRETGARINPARDVTVEDDVWLGAEVALLKGAHVGRGSVIGWRAVVTGAIPPHCVAAGIPARVIRENVSWRE